jgi:hypothetical protein
MAGSPASPGSHKANFALPEDWKELEVDPPRPWVTPVTGPAGTAIVFTEAMSHGTLPWSGAGERRTVFLKYNPHPIAWSARFYDRDRYPGLTERQRADPRAAERAVRRSPDRLTPGSQT